MKSHPRRLPGFRAVGHGGFHVGTHRRGIANGILWTLPPTHTFLWGYLIWGHLLIGGIHVCEEGGTSTFDPEGHQRLAALGGSRSCATADGTPVDTDAKNCVPPSRPLMGRGEVESWLKHGDDVFSQSPFVSDETGFCVFRGKKHTTT